MRFINCLAIAVALAATAASAAPVIDPKETFTTTLDEGHLAKRGWNHPAYLTGHSDKAEAVEKRFYRPPDALLEAHLFKAEAAENTRGNRYENPSDREGHPDIQISRRAWHGPGSAHCIDKSRGCYSEE